MTLNTPILLILLSRKEGLNMQECLSAAEGSDLELSYKLQIEGPIIEL